jgi:hypothetical protein
VCVVGEEEEVSWRGPKKQMFSATHQTEPQQLTVAKALDGNALASHTGRQAELLAPRSVVEDLTAAKVDTQTSGLGAARDTTLLQGLASNSTLASDLIGLELAAGKGE